ncbi:non-ribosomal peptide synthetase [Streptomyces sp. NPDC098789]|uniref:non-ribosomal peptide synthetase n=1 Tax=Streptomyces sp. NPDC098789 TaxID=3366098 RepID=UPI00382033FE
MPPDPLPPAGIVARVAAHALATPDALAVHDGRHDLTYAQLIANAAQLAQALRLRGIGPGSAVGLLVPHSVRAVVAQLAVWWAGGHYVPLDPDHPDERITMTLRETGAALTVGDPDLLADSPVAAAHALPLPPLPFPVLPRAAGAPAPVAEPAPYDPDATAYVLYTSGSTGRPKGVALTHRGAESMATGLPCDPLRPGDRMLFHSPMAFDAAAFEVWAPLAHGATVVVCATGRPAVEHLATEAAHLGADVVFLTTSLFHHLAARDSALFGLVRTVVTGGEELSGAHARRVLRLRPDLELVNAYGPTEATTFATAHRVHDADCAGAPPLGHPLPGAGAHVLDGRLRPVPRGATGELWLSGARLAAGYVAQPALTAERFVGPTPGDARRYRTGDLVSVRADGALVFHGRTDEQVKVRGHRVEPGEVEHVLLRHPGVREAVVVVRRTSVEDARLTAFVVPEAGARCDTVALRDHVSALLPAHLVPGTWVLTDGFPLTGSGKADRRALARDPLPPVRTGGRPGIGDRPAADGVAAPPPLSPVQRVVADAWSAALGRPVDRPDADFFALGGHSLLALTVVEDLRRDLGAETALAAFYADPTVAGHGALLEAALREELR